MGFVYFIRNESGRVKIGSTTDPVARLKQLQTGNPERLTLIDTIHTDNQHFVEKLIHKEFRANRLVGEWFHLSVETVEEIIAKYKKVDIRNVQYSNAEIYDLMQVSPKGIYIVPDGKYTTIAIVNQCEYSEDSLYVTEISVGKGFQHNFQYQIDKIPRFWTPIGTELMPF